jgi:hypothetical protein
VFAASALRERQSPRETDVRFFDLVESDAGCGSRAYAGSFVGPQGRREITIVDHRQRQCTDAVPARLVITETSALGSVTRYSADAHP